MRIDGVCIRGFSVLHAFDVLHVSDTLHAFDMFRVLDFLDNFDMHVGQVDGFLAHCV
jgi:hypothetical protein